MPLDTAKDPRVALLLALPPQVARALALAVKDIDAELNFDPPGVAALEAAVAAKKASQVTAVARKIALTGSIEGGKAEERITRLEKEITNAPPAIKPIYQAILAQWYWQYFQQNRWRFMQRTATAEAPATASTTCPRLISGSTFPFGRSKCASKTTLPPLAVSMRAVPSPKPDAPPVTMKTLPAMSMENSLC